MYGIQRLRFIHGLDSLNLIRNCKARCVSYVLSRTVVKFTCVTNSGLMEQQSYLHFPYHQCRPNPTTIAHIQRKYFSKKMPSVDEEFRHLDYNQLMVLRNQEKNYLIDVREKTELDETGVLPGAFHIPLGEIEKALTTPEDEFKKVYNFDKPSPDDQVIFSCRSGKRSLVALEKALAKGFTNAKHYKGGWLDWEKNISEPK